MTVDWSALARITDDGDPAVIDPLTYSTVVYFDGEDVSAGTWSGYVKNELTDTAPLALTIGVAVDYDANAVDEDGDAIEGGATSVEVSFDGDELQALIEDGQTEWNGWLEVSRPDDPVKGFVAEIRIRRNVNWTAA